MFTLIFVGVILMLLFWYQLKSSEGRADCAWPMLWAAETKKLVDVFIIFTDQPCGTCSSDDAVTPVKALRQYCDSMSHPGARYDSLLNPRASLRHFSLMLEQIALTFLMWLLAHLFWHWLSTRTQTCIKWMKISKCLLLGHFIFRWDQNHKR